MMTHPLFALLPAAGLATVLLGVLGWLEFKPGEDTTEVAVVFAPGTAREEAFLAVSKVPDAEFVRFGAFGSVAVLKLTGSERPKAETLGALLVMGVPEFGNCFNRSKPNINGRPVTQLVSLGADPSSMS